MIKSVIYKHPYDNGGNSSGIAEKINAPLIYIHAKEALKDFDSYDVVGIGVGYNTNKKYQQLLKFIEKFPVVKDKKAFIFYAIDLALESRLKKDFEKLLNLLESKGFEIINDFNITGFRTASILKCISEIANENEKIEEKNG